MAFLRHKRDANARRTTPTAAKIAAPVAVLVTLGVVGAGVLGANPELRDVVASGSQASAVAGMTPAEREDVFLSRSFSREDSADAKGRDALERAATRKAIRQADRKLWSTADLNLWSASGNKAKKLGILEERKRVLVTGRRDNGRAEIVLDKKARWVTATYLSREKPAKPEPEASTSSDSSVPAAGGACTNGSSVPGGVSPNVVAVHRAVCAAFPELTSYGTFRSDGEHAQGLAIDIMVSGSRGWQVADFLRSNYSNLGISYLIYSQKIWSVDRGGEGWRGMSSRGSTTADHYDHVHVTTY